MIRAPSFMALVGAVVVIAFLGGAIALLGAFVLAGN